MNAYQFKDEFAYSITINLFKDFICKTRTFFETRCDILVDSLAGAEYYYVEQSQWKQYHLVTMSLHFQNSANTKSHNKQNTLLPCRVSEFTNIFETKCLSIPLRKHNILHSFLTSSLFLNLSTTHQPHIKPLLLIPFLHNQPPTTVTLHCSNLVLIRRR